MNVYRIRDWDSHFENNRTRALKRLDWVPVPNKHDGDGFTDLMSRPNGPAIFGAWNLILQVASKCEPRGTLVRQTTTSQSGTQVPEGAKCSFRPHSAESISRITRCDVTTIKLALAVCSEIGWIEVTQAPDDACENHALGCGEDVTIRHPPAEKRLWNGREGNGREGKRVRDATASHARAGPHPELIAYHSAKWADAHDGTKYHFQSAKDGAAVGRILKAVGNDVGKAKQIVDAYLQDDEPFVVKRGHTLAHLGSSINSYLSLISRSSSRRQDTGDPAATQDVPQDVIDAASAEIRAELELKGGPK